MMSRLNDTFVNIADRISSAMGTPLNILLWVLAVALWFAAFILHPDLQNSSFIPAWFTSQAFNFPLNTVTTLAELYIGFLVAAAANRVERHNRAQMDHIDGVASALSTHSAQMAATLLDMMQDLHAIAAATGVTLHTTPPPEPAQDPNT